MAEFNTNFEDREYEVLLESLGEWESSEDGLLAFIERLRILGDPPQEVLDEAPPGFADWWKNMKEEMLSREQKAKDNKKEKMEEATILKAKLIMLRREAFDDLADDLFHGKPDDDSNAPKEPGTPQAPSEAKDAPEPPEAKDGPKQAPDTQNLKKKGPPPKPKQTRGKNIPPPLQS
jgi:hypothetical protein